MSADRERVEWARAEFGPAEELHLRGCWARVYRLEAVRGRDGQRLPDFYWSAGAKDQEALISGSASKEGKAKRRALRALLLCQKVVASARPLRDLVGL